ncbi:hypothetical protein QCBJ_01595 [Pseudomonas sp. QC2]|uniref:hypothetical protein n=1 Tax=Pseudomonas sp. QC2 TaxID=2065822 RepID=UPI000C7E695A|nr:hypothetical protein [Pseudomonas sp. QC2]PLR64780.1 hypothetical protein QCBJ_01595 [Pseudomonas sp. QC2]
MKVRDCVTATGQIRNISELRAEASHNGKAQSLYLNNPRMVGALMEYLQERYRRRRGLGESDDYLGMPRQTVIPESVWYDVLAATD